MKVYRIILITSVSILCLIAILLGAFRATENTPAPLNNSKKIEENQEEENIQMLEIIIEKESADENTE